ncbi:MAG: cupin domain-containing protein [Candidatus Caldatribacterium sp.]|nr:cupin domain-containing protein [Candidatus Caldatribacterium sp.]
MEYCSLDEAVLVASSEAFSGWKMYDRENVQVVHILVPPGGSVPLHATPQDVLFYVLEGYGVFVIGEEEKQVGPHTLIASPRGLPHGVRNESLGSLRFLVVKLPVQE